MTATAEQGVVSTGPNQEGYREFSLGEFLDRYGMRLAQLGNVLNVLGPLADAARTAE